jgi:hypothetical protein
MASAFSQAQGIFRAIRGNTELIEEQRAAYIAAARSLTSTTGGIQVESATVNGQSFSGKATSTPAERFEILKLVMAMVANDSAGSRTTRARFL